MEKAAVKISINMASVVAAYHYLYRTLISYINSLARSTARNSDKALEFWEITDFLLKHF
jgi:hypothetical protein